jgi:glycosyltransferase involved in cell wall biosynthesis
LRGRRPARPLFSASNSKDVNRAMKVLAVIPAYKEEDRVGATVRGVLEYLTDVLVVDDGSADATADEARAAGAAVLRQEPNQGKGAALVLGFAYALENGYDAVVTLDADGQHDPSAIPAMTAELEAGADVVIGARKKDVLVMPPQRIFSNTWTSVTLTALTGALIRDSQSGYRALRAEVLRSVPLTTTKYDLESEQLVKTARRGFRIAHVTVPTIYGTEKSKINVPRDMFLFYRVVFRDLLSRLDE